MESTTKADTRDWCTRVCVVCAYVRACVCICVDAALQVCTRWTLARDALQRVVRIRARVCAAQVCAEASMGYAAKPAARRMAGCGHDD